MKSIIRLLTAGIFVGLIICVALIVAIALKTPEAAGSVSQEFLGVSVLESTKMVSDSGGFSTELTPRPGILLPLLSPALFFLSVHFIIQLFSNRANLK